MSSHFCNTLLLGASPAEVAQAIVAWQTKEGRVLDPHRQRFNLFADLDHRRFYLLTRDHWTIILGNQELEKAGDLTDALSAFPVVLQLWANDGKWGCKLEESGRRTATLHSRNALAERTEAVAKMAAVCGCPGRVGDLRRIITRRTLFSEKSPSEFAAALGVPLAVLEAVNVDEANAGITETRSIGEWQVQLLAFNLPPSSLPADATPELEPLPSLDSLSPEDKEEFEKAMKRMQKLMWVFKLLRPLTLLFGFVAIILAKLGLMAVVILNQSQRLRRRWFGAAVNDCDEFVHQLQLSEPTRIQVSGSTVINLRHGCQLTLPPGTRALPELFRKPAFRDDPVFGIELGSLVLGCEAYLHRGPGYCPTNFPLEGSRSFETEQGLPVRFQKRVSKTQNHTRHHNDWDIQLPGALYRFSLSSETELEANQLSEIEQVIRSFRPA